MKLKKLILLLVALVGLTPGLTAWAAEGCLAGKCHPDLRTGSGLHQPVAAGKCSSCHKSSGQNHPGPPGAFQLVASGNELCTGCHGKITVAQGKASGAEAHGQCTGCHDPHRGAAPNLLRVEGGKLCLQCHDEIAKLPNLHGPVKAGGCRFCHQIHGSSQPRLLKAQGTKVCFPCHGGIAETIKKSKSQHSPVADGVCWDCHTPHGSKNRPLLKGAYPKAFYAAYREDRFELCFSCHAQGGIEYGLTSEATGFRNGTKNLHAVHVNRPSKGRVCKTCHAVHGGDQEKLIWRFTPEFGAWDIPLRFVKTDTGGTCFVGCHNPKAYDRFRVIVNP